MSQSPPVWFITGASAGFGHQITLAALSKGHRVIATARNPSKIAALAAAGADTMALDVTSSLSSLQATAAEAHSKYGRITYLINCAGYILEGAVEEVRPEETQATFNTNVFGMLNVTRAFLPYLRAEAEQHKSSKPAIANFGSVGSWTGGAGWSHYAGTKWAVSGITESLHAELLPLGINVTVVEPGYFRSNFLAGDAMVHAEKRIKVYENSAAGEARRMLEATNGKQPGDVVKGSQVIVDVLTGTGVAQGKAGEVPVRLMLGKDCVGGIRGKMESTEKLLGEWEAIITGTDHDDVKSG